MELKVDIKSDGVTSAYVGSSFDKAKKLLEDNYYQIISLEENACLRMKEGKNSFIFKYGNWTREGFVCVPNKGIYIVRNSPILDDAEKATEAHKKHKEFYISDEQVEKSLEYSVKVPFGTTGPYNMATVVPVEEFDSNEVTNFAFGVHAGIYGKFMKSFGLKNLKIWLPCKDYVDKQKNSFVRQVLSKGFPYGLSLDGYLKLLDSNYSWLRGTDEVFKTKQLSKTLSYLGIRSFEHELLKVLRGIK